MNRDWFGLMGEMELVTPCYPPGCCYSPTVIVCINKVSGFTELGNNEFILFIDGDQAHVRLRDWCKEQQMLSKLGANLLEEDQDMNAD